MTNVDVTKESLVGERIKIWVTQNTILISLIGPLSFIPFELPVNLYPSPGAQKRFSYSLLKENCRARQ